ncbi:conserved hypothetical protein [uncultured Alphaproteobacteria bacterium]|uniref:DUF2934 domain-containing protein n=1 Tax=uncultured Alphaproteobacteria bacterium TaxID=91750 RepID=A0A212JLB6_9PROT|nr:conserved hypothetical protein [uncultured Alphaproteobacteria bacterium]
MTETTETKIRDRAYALWQQHGCTEGRDWDFWLQAEREILGDAATGIPPVAKATKPRVAKPKTPAAAKPKAPAKPRGAAKSKP